MTNLLFAAASCTAEKFESFWEYPGGRILDGATTGKITSTTASISVANTLFQSFCSMTSNGGAILLTSDELNLSVGYSSFLNCSSPSNSGGAIYFAAGASSISTCCFYMCEAGDCSVSSLASNYLSVAIVNSVWSYSGTNRGVCMQSPNDTAKLINSTTNFDGGYGTAMYFFCNKTGNCSYTTLFNNTGLNIMEFYDGSLLIGSGTLNNCQFISNNATTYSVLRLNLQLFVTNCTFLYNNGNVLFVGVSTTSYLFDCYIESSAASLSSISYTRCVFGSSTNTLDLNFISMGPNGIACFNSGFSCAFTYVSKSRGSGAIILALAFFSFAE